MAFGVLGGTLLFPALSGAGNKQYVERQVKNLDDLNKKIVQGFSDVPQHGVVSYEAIITGGDSKNSQVKIIEKQIEIIPSPEAVKPPMKETESLLEKVKNE